MVAELFSHSLQLKSAKKRVEKQRERWCTLSTSMIYREKAKVTRQVNGNELPSMRVYIISVIVFFGFLMIAASRSYLSNNT